MKTSTKMTPGAGVAKATLQFKPVDPGMFYAPLTRAYSGDAGYDLTACRGLTIPPHGIAQIPTNIAIALPPGTWAMITGRSSTFYRRGLFVNPGIIDNGWRGELLTLVYNFLDKPVHIRRGERISQLIIFDLRTPEAELVQELPDGERGVNGFGSTGGFAKEEE